MFQLISNYQPRPIIDAFQLTPAELDNVGFDLSTVVDYTDVPTFFRYRGWVYDLSDIPIAPDSLRALGWDGAASDSFFSGIVVRYFAADGEFMDDHIIVGRYYE